MTSTVDRNRVRRLAATDHTMPPVTPAQLDRIARLLTGESPTVHTLELTYEATAPAPDPAAHLDPILEPADGVWYTESTTVGEVLTVGIRVDALAVDGDVARILEVVDAAQPALTALEQALTPAWTLRSVSVADSDPTAGERTR